jgi:hypothetical protein
MADRAKIAFFDIAGPTSQALTVPSDINRYLFPWAYMAGARIHSNSWGTENGVRLKFVYVLTHQGAYSSSSGDADMFSFNNKDFLILAAAGNSGNCENSFYSVGSPATAKVRYMLSGGTELVECAFSGCYNERRIVMVNPLCF